MKKNFNLLLLGYVVLFLSVLGFDQSSKFHAEQAFYEEAPHSSIGYAATSKNVFTLGVPPDKAQELHGDASKGTENWLVFDVTYLRNEGAVWGVMSDMDKTLRLTIFYSVTAIAVFAVLWMFAKSHPGNRLYRVSLTLVLAGALGNFIDRLLLHYVIDWLHFYWRIFGWEYNFPVFNIADVAIDVGIAFMFLDMILQEREARQFRRGALTAGPRQQEAAPASAP